LIKATWTPYCVTLEQRANENRIGDFKIPLRSRAVTFDGGEHESKYFDEVNSRSLRRRVVELTNRIVSHLNATVHKQFHIWNIELFFKVSSAHDLVLLWCSNVKLSCVRGGGGGHSKDAAYYS
jgi:hypothetical protein